MTDILNENDFINKAKKRLRNAVGQIMEEENCEIYDIKVSDLAQRAGISRATFYNHYENIECFRKETFNYLIDIVIKQMFVLLNGGRENLKENCKEKNLIIDRDDRRLIAVTNNNVSFDLVRDNIKSICQSFVNNGFGSIFGEEYVSDKASGVDFFLEGYIISLFDFFSQDFEYKKLIKEMNYTFDIFDFFFPDKKV